MINSLRIDTLLAAYRDGHTRPSDVAGMIHRRLAARGDDGVWISRRPESEVLAEAHDLERRGPADLPLYGIPFAIKDNIDAEGCHTTAACADARLESGDDAEVVRRLRAAGALLIGKTNMDQLATGLVGVRSPFGVPPNPFDADFVPGGSSSGSAVAVADGLVSFALGTDTAGSGRVPAAFNNLIGVKPTRGLVSTRGVFPACRSLDCVSIFALTAADAATVLSAAAGFDPRDPYARPRGAPHRVIGERPFRFGCPAPGQREFFGDEAAGTAFAEAVRGLENLGGTAVPVDMQPFREAAALLYNGPWVAERSTALSALPATTRGELEPAVAAILDGAAAYDAADAFAAQHRLAAIAAELAPLWDDIDVLVTPTTPTTYRVADVRANPIELNSRLGHYTNFVNLLDLAAVAVPGGFREDGLPAGVTLVGPAWSDAGLLALAERFHLDQGPRLGATAERLDNAQPRAATAYPADYARVAVVGAHLSGQPLNHQLTERGGRRVCTTQTAAAYRLYALTASSPPKPGLVRDDQAGGAIEVEIWALPLARYGEFVALIPSPLGIGTLELADGSRVQGFLAEHWAVADAEEITALGGWRRYVGAA